MTIAQTRDVALAQSVPLFLKLSGGGCALPGPALHCRTFIRHVSCLAWPCIVLQDVYQTAEAVKAAGGKVVREAGPIPGLNTKITSVLDPDGEWLMVDVTLTRCCWR